MIDPTFTGTCALWIDFSDLSTMSGVAVDGNAISTINSKHLGTAVSYTQATSGKRPIYKTNQFGTRAAAQLSGGQFLKSTTTADLSEGDIFIVCKVGTSAQHGYLLTTYNSAGSDFWLADFRTGSFETNVDGQTNSFGSIADSTKHIVQFRSTGVDYGGWVDGENRTADIASGGNDNGSWIGDVANKDTSAIGGFESVGLGSFYMTGLIGEILYYSSPLSEANRIIITQYLADKWNLPLTTAYITASGGIQSGGSSALVPSFKFQATGGMIASGVSGYDQDAYIQIFHLAESGNGTVSEYIDSESGDDGTGGGGFQTPAQVAGKFGYGQKFDGNDYISIPADEGEYVDEDGDTFIMEDSSGFFDIEGDPISANNSITLSGWLYFNSPPFGNRVLVSRGTDNYNLVLGHSGSRGWAAVQVAGASAWQVFQLTGRTDQIINNWFHLALVWVAGTGALSLYVNGVLESSVITALPLVPTSGGFIGRRVDGFYLNNTTADEVRLSNIARSSDWLLAEATLQVQIGVEQTCPRIGGHARLEPSFVMQASGGIRLSNLPTHYSQSYHMQASGGITASGSAVVKQVYRRLSSGGIVAGGSAGMAKFAATGGGGMHTGGTAAWHQTQNFVATSGARISGSAAMKQTQKFIATAGITAGGTSTYSQSFHMQASGGMTCGGRTQLNLIQPTGGARAGGSAAMVPTFYFKASGGMKVNSLGSQTVGGNILVIPHLLGRIVETTPDDADILLTSATT